MLQFPKNLLILNYLFSVPKLTLPNENYLPLLLNFILMFVLDLSSLPLQPFKICSLLKTNSQFLLFPRLFINILADSVLPPI